MTTTTPERDFTKEPLTELEKAYLTIAHFQLQYDRLQTAARAVLNTRREFSSAQSAVLTYKLDELEAVVAESAPKWGSKP